MDAPRGNFPLLAGVVIGVLLAYAIVVTGLLLSRGENPLRTTTVVIATIEPTTNEEPLAEGSSTPAFQPGKHPALAGLECPIEEEEEPERHDVSEAEDEEDFDPGEEVTLESEWLAALCTFDARIAINANGRVDISGGEFASIRLQDEELYHLPGLVDSTSPTFWMNDALYTFNSRAWPSISTGADGASLAEPAYVEFYEQVGTGGRWMESIWRDPSTDYLYGWYHREPEDVRCLTAPVIGAAISYDFGLTWMDQGTVLEDPYDLDCDYENGYFAGGNGDFAVILDTEQEYFYFLYSNYGGPIQEQGIGIARSSFAEMGQPGTVWKWDGLEWIEPGIGGSTYPVIPADTSWAGPNVDAFWGPSVHWNSYLERYVMLLNRSGGLEWEQEGVYISFSTDLLTWTIPHKLFDTNAWYPQIIGTEPGESDTLAGQYARLYLSGISLYGIEFMK
jgi:hypothetical protein